MKASLERILVTGATGTVGNEIVNQLSKSDIPVKIKAAVHLNGNARKVGGGNDEIETVPIDYNRPESLKAGLSDVDKLFLLSRDSPTMVELTSNVITEAKKSGIKHIVGLSAKGADLKAESPSLRMHRQVEIIIEESGIPFTFLRPNEFMQNFINLHGPSIKSNNTFYMAVGDSKVSIVDVRDIAAVGVQALTHSEKHHDKTYTITGKEALSYYQIADILSDVTGRKISYMDLSEGDFRRALRKAGVDDWFIYVVLGMLDSIYRSGIAAQVYSTVEEVTGRKPITFTQFAKDYADAFK
jgi:uncharacterized protein YbjT (DUF2867 family)